MTSYNTSKPFQKNTYQVETNKYKSYNIPYNTEEEISHRTFQERESHSPPIILCETGDIRNSRTHRHRYLFYPSISRLSPYSDGNTFQTFNNMNNREESKKMNSNFDLEQEINNLRDQNRLIKEEYLKRNNGFNEEGEGNNSGQNKNNIKNRAESANYNRKKGKYQDLLDKSNDLMNSINDLIKEEEGKKRGPLGYYNTNIRNYKNTRDNEFDEFVNRQKNLFNTENNGNKNKS